MYEIIRAIIVDSNSAFAFIVLSLSALMAALTISLYIWRYSMAQMRGRMHQVELEHRERMAKLHAEHPVLIGHDVSQRRVGQASKVENSRLEDA